MQFSKNWLSEFIDISLSTEEICSQLTMAGLEVDGYEHIKSKITGNDSIINLEYFLSLKQYLKQQETKIIGEIIENIEKS